MKPPPNNKALMEEALSQLQRARAELNAYNEPIAVIGMGCRFAGADDPEAFWRLLRDGVDATGELPGSRWDVDAFYDADPDAPGKMSSRRGGFLSEIDGFDAHFFGVSPREVLSMDPQQRLLLEVTWEALESAGQLRERRPGAPTGVFVGLATGDYASPSLMANDYSRIDAYALTGNAANAAVGRLSFTLGLLGPNVAVDTACSSSLVAVHLACQSLRNGECDLAVAGGVNIILSPANFIALSKSKVLAPDGRCKTFDASADGMARGEGCGMVVLKRLSQALKDRDSVLGVIRGSAVNHDGPASGFTVPSGLAQQALLRSALKRARVKPSEVQYVEAHGTGTPLGDPIEVGALGTVLASDRSPDKPLIIGSVKTNIGHAEAASGIAGLIKILLCFQRDAIPAHLHFRTPNPEIPWKDFPLLVPTSLKPWPRGADKRIAGVSSFGFSGTNAHVILEEPPLSEQTRAPLQRPVQVLALSAKSEGALATLASRYRRFLAERGQADEPEDLADICYSSNVGHLHFPHRLAVVAGSRAALLEKLDTMTAGSTPPGVSTGRQLPSSPRIAFFFTGQGAQHVGMGRELYERQPLFRETLDQCDELLRPELCRSLLSVLWGEQEGQTPLLHQTRYTQPALFALEYALARLWQAWGITPHVLVGHSIGEYAAACLAGVFSLEDALRLIAARGRLMVERCKPGAMASVRANAAQVRPLVEPYGQSVSIAALNAPTSTVISGEPDAVRNLVATLSAGGLQAQMLEVSHAFHSPLMEPMLEPFAQIARQIAYREPRIALISTLTGTAVGQEMTRSEYWVDQVRAPVRFADAMAQLQERAPDACVEIGPKPTLLGLGQQCLEGAEIIWLPSMRQGQDDWRQILGTLAALYVAGAPVDWSRFDADLPRQRIWSLPSYPFHRQRYWLTPPGTVPPAVRALHGEPAQHPLLGRRLRLAGAGGHELRFEACIRADSPAFLVDHRLAGTALLPASAYVEMAAAAGREVWGEGPHAIRDLLIQEALSLPKGEEHLLQVILSPQGDGAYAFRLFSTRADADEETWRQHASGTLLRPASEQSLEVESCEALRARCMTEVDVALYDQSQRQEGVVFGPSFRTVHQLWCAGDEAMGRVHLPAHLSQEAARCVLHPVLLDGAFQVLAAFLARDIGERTYLPIGVDSITLLRAPSETLWVHARRRSGASQQTLIADLELFNEDGALAARVEGLQMVATTSARLKLQTDSPDHWFYSIAWEIQPRGRAPARAPAPPSRRWLILADLGGTGARLAQRLAEQGELAVLAFAGPGSTCPAGVLSTTLDPGRPESFTALLEEFFPDGLPRGIVHLWGLDARLGQTGGVGWMPASGGALHFLQAIGKRGALQASRLWLVTRGSQPVEAEKRSEVQPAQAPLWGLGQVITREYPDLECIRIDLEPSSQLEPRQGAEDEVSELCQELLSPDGEPQVALRGGRRYVARLAKRSSSTTAHSELPLPEFRVATSAAGVLDNLRLEPLSRQLPGPGEISIRVCATALNFKDVLHALGMVQQESHWGSGADLLFGLECAGRIEAVGEGVTRFQPGDAVVAVALGALGSQVIVSAERAVAIPEGMGLAEAAGIPTAFMTSYYGLHHLADLRAGESVLIHAAAGGVGLAAVQLAQAAGAEVFATASPGKWEFLRSLGVRHIMNSRHLDFTAQVKELTGGRGVDVVLNSLSGDFIPRSLDVLASGGRFVELGKLGIWTHAQVAQARPDVRYLPFDLGEQTARQPGLFRELMGQILSEMQARRLRPLPTRIFPIQEVTEAFRCMAQARHVGKVVVAMPALSEQPLAHAKASYLVTGGLGGLGIEVAGWLIEEGAQHLVLVGRRPPESRVRERISRWTESGIQVEVVQADISCAEDVQRLFEMFGQTLPPLKGIIHAAGVLDDGLLAQLDWKRFHDVLAPKANGAWLLHRFSRALDLDFFVLFSSAAVFLGGPGQGSYAAANTFLDALAHHRRMSGLPALSINWGPWAEAGMAAHLEAKAGGRFAAAGLEPMRTAQSLRALRILLLERGTAEMAVLPVHWPRLLAQYPAGAEPPLLAAFRPAAAPATKAEPRASDPKALILSAPRKEQRPLLRSYICAQIAQVLHLGASTAIEPKQRLFDIGLDSLMAIELKNRLQSGLQRPLRSTLLFDYPTVEALTEHLASDALGLEPEQAAVPQASARRAVDDELARTRERIAELSDAEVEAMILRDLDASAGG